MACKFYVYVLKTLPDCQVFYVGKGSKARLFWHRQVLSRPRNKEYQRGVYKRMRAVLAGRNFIEEKVFETESEIEALLHEQALIRQYGFENLVNTQSHAFTGRRLKPEVGRLIAVRLRDYVKRCRIKYGTGHPPEVAAKISAANMGRKISAAAVAKRLQTWKANPINVERARQQAINLCRMHAGKKRSVAYCAKMSALRKGKPMPAGFGAKVSAGLTGKAARGSARSKYRGVSWFGPKKAWQCRIQQAGKAKLLGQFKLELDAAWTYDNAFEAAHGTRPNSTPRDYAVTRFRWGMHGLLIPVCS